MKYFILLFYVLPAVLLVLLHMSLTIDTVYRLKKKRPDFKIDTNIIRNTVSIIRLLVVFLCPVLNFMMLFVEIAMYEELKNDAIEKVERRLDLKKAEQEA